MKIPRKELLIEKIKILLVIVFAILQFQHLHLYAKINFINIIL